jgi:hypothetical protein
MNTSLLKFDRLCSSSAPGASRHPVSSPTSASASASASHPPHSGSLRRAPTA